MGDAAVHRLFVALRPDAGAARQLVRISRSLREAGILGKHVVDPSRWHITLHFLGDFRGYPEELAGRLVDASRRFSYRRFEISLDLVSTFAKRKPPLVVLCPDTAQQVVREFRRAYLEQVLAPQGIVAERRFVPHLTLGYRQQPLPKPVPVGPLAWVVREFMLVNSHVGRAHHEVIGRWPLGA